VGHDDARRGTIPDGAVPGLPPFVADGSTVDQREAAVLTPPAETPGGHAVSVMRWPAGAVSVVCTRCGEGVQAAATIVLDEVPCSG